MLTFVRRTVVLNTKVYVKLLQKLKNTRKISSGFWCHAAFWIKKKSIIVTCFKMFVFPVPGDR